MGLAQRQEAGHTSWAPCSRCSSTSHRSRSSRIRSFFWFRTAANCTTQRAHACRQPASHPVGPASHAMHWTAHSLQPHGARSLHTSPHVHRRSPRCIQKPWRAGSRAVQHLCEEVALQLGLLLGALVAPGPQLLRLQLVVRRQARVLVVRFLRMAARWTTHNPNGCTLNPLPGVLVVRFVRMAACWTTHNHIQLIHTQVVTMTLCHLRDRDGDRGMARSSMVRADHCAMRSNHVQSACWAEWC